MKKLFTPILMTLSLFMFSCQQEAIERSEVDQASAQDYLDTYVQNPVIFQVAEIHEQAEVITGFFITKSSEIHSFRMTKADFNTEKKWVNRSYLELLMDNSTGIVGRVNAEDLQEMYRLNLLSGRTQAKVATADASASVKRLTSSFVLKTQYTTWSDTTVECPIHHDPFAKSSFLDVELRSEMARNAQNNGRFVAKIVSWIDDQVEGLQFPQIEDEN